MDILDSHEQFKLVIITVEMPNFGSNITIEFLTKLSCGAEIQHVDRKPNENRKVKFVFEENNFRVVSFRHSLETIFKQGYLTVSEEFKNKYNTIWEYYVDLINGMDWYFDYSDDHSVWAAGQAKLERIKSLIRELHKVSPEKLHTHSIGLAFPGNNTYRNYL
jgi:hypothetical protein